MPINVGVSPSRLNLQRSLGSGLTQQGLSSGPTTALGGLGRIAQTIAGGLILNKTNQQQQERATAANKALLALAGGGATPATFAGGPPSVSSALSPARTAARPASPSIQELTAAAQQFPELASLLNPMIAAQLTPQKPQVVGPGGKLFGPGGVELASVPNKPPAVKNPVLKEIADPSSPTGTKFVLAEEAIGQPGPPRQEFRVETETNPDGTTTTRLVRGAPSAGAASGDLTKSTRSKLEQSITQSAGQLDRLAQIRTSMDPASLTLPTQLKNMGLAAFEKAGGTLSKEQRGELTRFTRGRSAAVRNLNRLLNELSGAAVSPAEAKRLKSELPNADDSPTQFMAKMQNAEEAIQAGIARSQQLLDSGVKDLQFDKDGEIINGPDLDTFIVTQPRGTIEASAVPGAEAGAQAAEADTADNADLIGADLSSMSPEQLEAWSAEMDRRGL